MVSPLSGIQQIQYQSVGRPPHRSIRGGQSAAQDSGGQPEPLGPGQAGGGGVVLVIVCLLDEVEPIRFAGAAATVPMLTEPAPAQRQTFDLLGASIPLTLK